MYDASHYEFELCQERLDAAGVTKEEFDLTNYCGLTYQELKSVTDAVLRWKAKQKAKANEVK